QFLRVIRKHWFRFFFVNIEAALDNLLVCVVETVVLQRSFFEPIKERVATWTREMKYFFYVDHLLHDLGLPNVSRNTVQYQRIDVRLEFMRFHGRIDRLSPKLHFDIVRN